MQKLVYFFMIFSLSFTSLAMNMDNNNINNEDDIKFPVKSIKAPVKYLRKNSPPSLFSLSRDPESKKIENKQSTKTSKVTKSIIIFSKKKSHSNDEIKTHKCSQNDITTYKNPLYQILKNPIITSLSASQTLNKNPPYKNLADAYYSHTSGVINKTIVISKQIKKLIEKNSFIDITRYKKDFSELKYHKSISSLLVKKTDLFEEKENLITYALSIGHFKIACYLIGLAQENIKHDDNIYKNIFHAIKNNNKYYIKKVHIYFITKRFKKQLKHALDSEKKALWRDNKDIVLQEFKYFLEESNFQATLKEIKPRETSLNSNEKIKETIDLLEQIATLLHSPTQDLLLEKQLFSSLNATYKHMTNDKENIVTSLLFLYVISPYVVNNMNKSYLGKLVQGFISGETDKGNLNEEEIMFISRKSEEGKKAQKFLNKIQESFFK